MVKEKQYRYSEIFKSIQGEGKYIGVPTIWLRFWGCNFECNGFGQKDPTNSDSWILPYKDIDLTDIKELKDLPVFEYGCDSSYSWSKKFAHLVHKNTAKEISYKLRKLLPEGGFQSEHSGQDFHMAFTGGEPMINQIGLVEIMKQFRHQNDGPLHVTIETNGTQMPRKEFLGFFGNRGMFDGELFWSCSPKLRASGENWKKAIKPKVIKEYNLISKKGQLKYVVDGTDECWDEVSKATDLYRNEGINWPVYIMPVGATVEEQENIQEKICLQTMEKGYNFSARLHCFVFGNKIGT